MPGFSCTCCTAGMGVGVGVGSLTGEVVSVVDIGTSVSVFVVVSSSTSLSLDEDELSLFFSSLWPLADFFAFGLPFCFSLEPSKQKYDWRVDLLDKPFLSFLRCWLLGFGFSVFYLRQPLSIGFFLQGEGEEEEEGICCHRDEPLLPLEWERPLEWSDVVDNHDRYRILPIQLRRLPLKSIGITDTENRRCVRLTHDVANEFVRLKGSWWTNLFAFGNENRLLDVIHQPIQARLLHFHRILEDILEQTSFFFIRRHLSI